MAWANCEECHGIGEIETESLIFGRPYYDKTVGLITPMYGKGDWAMTPCSCVGEVND